MGEFRQQLPLTGPDGSVHYGWARQPLFKLNMNDAAAMRRHPFRAWRTKRWEYYYVATPELFFSGMVAHVGYLGNVVVYLYDLQRDLLRQQSVNVPLGHGMTLADHPREGMTGVQTGHGIQLRSCMSADKKRVTVHWPAFDGHDDLDAELSFAWPEAWESLTVVDPLREGRFAYTTKATCLPATGHIHLGGNDWECEARHAFAEVDWSRGLFENTTLWKWATMSGCSGEHVVGFNLCNGFHDRGDNENALLLDGRITKLSGVSFTYDRESIMQPWHVTSPDRRVDVTFTPLVDRRSMTDLGIVHSHIHQLVGRYTGQIIPDGSPAIELPGIIGAAEDHDARW